jgi:MYXO-CTERM domain-containing protein
MKQLVPLTVVVAGALSGFSQGIVQFQNSATFLTPDVPAGSERLVYGLGSPLNSTTGIKLVGTNYVVELYVGPASTTDYSSLTPLASSISRFRDVGSPNAGKWGSTTLSGGFNSQIDLGVPIGTVVTLGVRMWDLRDSPTFTTVGFHGQSQLFSFTAADPASLPSTWVMEGFQSWALIPEPSAIAVGLLGVAGLLVIRRRKPNSVRSGISVETPLQVSP